MQNAESDSIAPARSCDACVAVEQGSTKEETQASQRHAARAFLPRYVLKQCLKSRTRLLLLFLYSAFCILTSAFPAQAIPTQEDVFRSIQNSEADQVDGRKVLAFLVAAVAVVIMIVLINNRMQQEERPKVVNHQAKLLRELMKSAGLKSSQVRQLKILSADLRQRGEPVNNLVTLLLCPSLIRKTREDETADKNRK